MTNPSVFLSYSHDSAAHKAWVRKLAEDLRGQGVDATLDQWDLRHGADLVAFMEAGIREAERVLMVCSSNYVRKAEQRKGGAGYEGMIVTSHVARSTDTVKFIPLVRDNPSEPLLPDFLGPRLWLDFRDDLLYAERLEDLLRELHDLPRFRKPPLGRPAFLSNSAELVSEPVALERKPATAQPVAAAQPEVTKPVLIQSVVIEPQLVQQVAAIPLQRITINTTTCLLRQETSFLRNLLGQNLWNEEPRRLQVEGYWEQLSVGVALTMVKIPPGTFLMGSPEGESMRLPEEGPQHEVTLDSFLMAQTPITQAQWRAVVGWQTKEGERWGKELDPAPSGSQGEISRLLERETNPDQRPVERVSWFDAIEFCSRLSQRTGRTYTLPSEAQWEYACRAGSTTPFHCGVTISTELANYVGNYSYEYGPKGTDREQTTEVASFPANSWGLHDMHGNVLEWCQDHWHATYKGAPKDGSAWLIPKAQEDELRLLRGGCWSSSPWNCRSSKRNRHQPGIVGDFAGLRVVCLPQGCSS
jgi:formylglycine-generating enzyme required for sulfatase activity